MPALAMCACANNWGWRSSRPALRQAALEGLGIALLADYLVAPGLRSGALCEVLPDMRLPDLWLKAMVPNNRAELPRIRALLEWLSVTLGQLALSEGFVFSVQDACAQPA